MPNPLGPLGRYAALSVLVAIVVTAVQAALISLLVRGYQDVMNRRVGELALAVEGFIIEEEMGAGRDFRGIEERLRTRLTEIADDDEMAVYDGAGKLLLRSSGALPEMPGTLSEDLRARIDTGEIVLPDLAPIGVLASGTAREVQGRKLYLVRLNRSFRNAAPGLLQLGLGALMLPMLLVGLGGAFAILRLTGRQLAKVDRVLRVMASGDLSARMSLPVDPDTAGVVLSFNRMAEKVEETIQKLRRSDEIRRQLLADVTHELNTPLTSVLGYLETLCMEDLPLSEERRKKLTQIAYEEAVNLRALIEDLTTLSRLDAEGLPLERVPLVLGGIVERVVRRLSQIAEKRGVPVRTEIDPRVEVRGDPQRLDQVIRNLVENALRHTTPPGDVTVVVRRAGESAIVEVRDRGAGIPPEDLARIGQRFLRTDRSRARHTGGRGLGLAITVGLIEAHGGKVQFESELGRGTTVRITLPLRGEADAASVPAVVIPDMSGPISSPVARTTAAVPLVPVEDGPARADLSHVPDATPTEPEPAVATPAPAAATAAPGSDTRSPKAPAARTAAPPASRGKSRKKR